MPGPQAMHHILRRVHQRLQDSPHIHVRRIWAASRHPFAVPVLAFAALLLIAVAVLAVLQHNGASLEPAGNDIVIISHDHQTQIVPSHEPTVGALLAKLHIAVHPGDIVEPDVDTAIHQDDFRINIYRAAPVKIIDNGSASLSSSAARTPRSIAAQAGLTVYAEDIITADPTVNFLQEKAIGSVVTIDRSIPITLDINGFPAATRTQATTVGAFLQEKHIALGKTGRVDPAFNTPLVSGQAVHVTRDGTGIKSVSEDIPMPVQYIYDSTLAYGTSAVRQVGNPGRRILTYQIVVKNGQVVTKTLVQTVVTAEAITQIVVQGTNLSGIKGDMALAGISSDQYQYADYIISHESGWCPTKWQGEWGTCPAYHGTPTSSSVGYGLCQATPGYKMSTAGADWATNPITQLKWCTGYANARYGSWHNAYSYWLAHHNW